MTNKEMVYSFAECYRDDILLDLVNRSEEILSDPTTANLIKTLVDLEIKDKDSRRRGVMLGVEPVRFSEAIAYRTVLYGMLIRGKKFDRD